MTIKNIFFVETSAMNNSAKFQLYPHMASEELNFFYFFYKFSSLVAIATNQIERFGLKWLNTCVKFSAMRQQ